MTQSKYHDSATEDTVTIQYHYDELGQLFGLRYNEVDYIYQRDIFGSIMGIIDLEGKVFVSYTYNGFGEPSIDVQTVGMTLNDLVVASKLKDHNIFMYKGYIYDQDTKMYYLNSRYYHPSIGRFITPDDPSYLSVESINGLNLYAYCGNNPVMYSDGNGTSPEWWEWVISGAQLAVGIGLMFVPGAQGLGVALFASGATSMATNIMAVSGVDGKTASLISSGLSIIGGVALLFTPFAGVGANLIGSGLGGIAGGYISEGLGGSFTVGAMIGNIAGGILGGKIYDGIQTMRLANNGVVVIGEGMSRVTAKANEIGASVYGGMPGFKNLSKILPKGAMNQLGLAHNARWIGWVSKSGADIVDIGIIAGRNSPNYIMEILKIGRYLL